MGKSASRVLLGVEQLEERHLLSADPFLAVITHGLLLPGMKRPPAWANTMAKSIESTAGRFSEDGNVPSSSDSLTVDESSGFSFPWPAGDKNLILRVGWPSLGLNWKHTADLAQSIRNFLAGQDKPWDLLFVGHSRGAILNSAVFEKLQGAPNIDYVQMVTLDATAGQTHLTGTGPEDDAAGICTLVLFIPLQYERCLSMATDATKAHDLMPDSIAKNIPRLYVTEKAADPLDGINVSIARAPGLPDVERVVAVRAAAAC